MLNTLENLIKLARERKSSPVDGSYTNKLLTDKALSKAKVLEEVDELIEAVEEDILIKYMKLLMYFIIY
jgi:phosphoribosyl-ATP pyrophosphohydrolase